MRTLEWNEVEQVSGGAVPLVALVPVIKAITPIANAIVTAAGTAAATWIAASTVSKALENAAEVCKDGGEASVKSLTADMACSGKKNEGTETKGAPLPNPPAGLLRAMIPEFLG